jgi:hypothetical protein
VAARLEQVDTITSTELAAQIWGESEGHSRSRGSRAVRTIARRNWPEESPGKGREWRFTLSQADTIRDVVTRGYSTDPLT